MDTIQNAFFSLSWIFPLVLIFGFYIYDLVARKRSTQKLREYPIVGSPSCLASRSLLNLIFAGNAARLVESGYYKVLLGIRLEKFKYVLIMLGIVQEQSIPNYS
jgi:hypothetical protein